MPSLRATAESGPDTASASAPAFRFADLAAIVRRRRTLIFGVATAVVACTFLALLVWPARYAASATIVLEGRKNSVTEQSAVLSALPIDPASLQNQIQILTSRDLAGRVIDKLALTQDPEFSSPGLFAVLFGGDYSPDAAVRQRNLAIDAFLSHLSVDVVGLSTTITVTFSARDPDKAALIANAIADAYVEGQVNAKVVATEQATGWLTERIRQLARQTQDAETAVQRYKAEHNLSEGPEGVSLADQQLVGINTQLVQARSDLAQKQANYDRVRSLLASGQAADASQVVASPLIVQLRQQEAELARQEAQLSTRYGPRHPKMVEIESQRHDLDAKIDEEVHRIAGSLQNDVTTAGAQVASLVASLARAQAEASKQNMARVELRALQANAQSTRTMYESFVTRLRETQDQEEIQTPDARVVSRASPPTSPAAPRRIVILAAAIPAGLLLGLLIALLAERFGAGVAPGRQSVAPATAPARRVPVLAEFPDLARMSASPMPAADYVIDYPASAFARAIAALDRQIAGAGGWSGPRVLMVTSAEPGEGKTAIALSLARAAAGRGQRVVLIEGDARWPAAARMMRVPQLRSGLAEVVTGAAPVSRSLARDARSNVLLLSWAARPARLRELLSSQRMAQLMAHLRASCDLVVVDAPPVRAPESAAYLALTDAVLFVAGTEPHAQPAAVDALAVLAAQRAPTIGIALAS
jgi:polysaccharide biosynthesis transport protein